MATVSSYAPVPKDYMNWYTKGSLKEFVDAGIATLSEAEAVNEFNTTICRLAGWKFEGWAFAKPPTVRKLSDLDEFKALGIVSKVNDAKCRKLALVGEEGVRILDSRDIRIILNEEISI